MLIADEVYIEFGERFLEESLPRELTFVQVAARGYLGDKGAI
jgi:acyl CoA:acetate/3-ketoacid CoA transferase